MITSLEQASGVILQWFEEVRIDQYKVSTETLPMLVNQSCDFIAEACNSANELTQKAAIKTLFVQLVEYWNDSFSMRGRNAYAAIFGRIVWKTCEAHSELSDALNRYGIDSEESLRERHARIRSNENFSAPDEAKHIIVLSRVTIGADILLSSVLCQRLHQRYPDATITLIGDKKLHGLFGAFDYIQIESLSYARRGPLSTRLESWLGLEDLVATLNADFVIAPDSRLDQLGLLPVCDEEQYVLWENLQLEDNTESLSILLDQWACKQLQLDPGTEMYPQLGFSQDIQNISDHIEDTFQNQAYIAVKLDYGGNADKAVSREWEIEILRCMIDRGWRILIDRGYGEEELKNSDAIMRGIGFSAFDISESDPDHGKLISELTHEDIAEHDIIRFYGSIAAWAACAKHCQLAFSYDSVGHHLAAALDVPLIIAFTGYEDDAFPKAWQPRGPGTIDMVCIPMDKKNNRNYLEKIIEHIARLTKRIKKA